jgi:Domain of unknown function (DUF4410)
MAYRSSIPTFRLVVLGAILATASSALLAEGPVRKFLNGDTKVTVLDSYKGSECLSKPTSLVVSDFDVPNDVITLDKSMAQRAASYGVVAHIKGDTGRDASQSRVAADINAAFAKKLKSELKKSSLTADTTAGGSGGNAPAGTLVVRGNFTAVKLGNKSKRVFLGFGLGASDVKAHVSVSLNTESGSVLLAEFDLNTKSGKRPGAVALISPESAAVNVASNDIGDRNATVEADASRMAKAVAKQIKKILSNGQWATPPAEASQAGAPEASLPLPQE